MREILAVIGGVLILLGVAAGAPELRRLWRNQPCYLNGSRPSWFYIDSDVAWRRWLQAMPSAFASAVTFGLAVLVLAGVPGAEQDLDRKIMSWPVVTTLTLTGAGCLGLVLALSTARLNRPKVLVPPHLRREPGSESRTARR